MKLGILVAAIVALSAGATCGVIGGIVAASSGPDRWFGTGFASIETRTHALVADPDDIADDDEDDHNNGGSKIRVGRRNSYAAGFEPSGGAVFLGVGPAADVDRYLDGVAREYITDIDWDPLQLDTDVVEGTRSPAPPHEEEFWVAQTSGVERQQLTWRIEDDLLLVVMRENGAPIVAGEIAFSSGLEYFMVLAVAVGGVGTVMFIAGIGLAFEAIGPMFRRRAMSPPRPSTLPTTD